MINFINIIINDINIVINDINVIINDINIIIINNDNNISYNKNNNNEYISDIRFDGQPSSSNVISHSCFPFHRQKEGQLLALYDAV